MIELTLPWPPSVNKTWVPIPRNKWGRKSKVGLMLNPKVKDYRLNVISVACKERWFKKGLKGQLFAKIILTPSRRGIYDIDNRLKTPFDALKLAGLYEDDSQIEKTFISKAPVKSPGKIEITFIELDSHPVFECLICGGKNENHVEN